MGNGMNKILDGLYVGNIRDAKDQEQLNKNEITHILAIHEDAKKLLQDKVYFCLPIMDSKEVNISQYFKYTNDFIHQCRTENGNCLVHCLVGVSRSVSVTVAYVMTVTSLGWQDALRAVRGARHGANPNFGFQRQLLNFEHEGLSQERKRLHEKFPTWKCDKDEDACRQLMHEDWIVNGDGASSDKPTYPLAYDAYKNMSAEEREKAMKEIGEKVPKIVPPKEKDSSCNRTQVDESESQQDAVTEMFKS